MTLGTFQVLLLSAALSAGAVTYPVWPSNAIPFAAERPCAGRVLPTTDDDVRYTDVDIPTLTYVKTPAAETKSVPGMLILPGGGYKALSWTIEGSEVVQWCRVRGMNAFLLKYRVPDKPDAALADAQRAMRYIRFHAARLATDPNRLGVIGGSAGANLAARLSSLFATNAYARVDELDTLSCRPDFTVLMYPWHIADGKDGADFLPVDRTQFKIPAGAPPAFIVQSGDDPARVENALAYYIALKRANVPAELHVYPRGGRGGHGFAFRKYGKPTDDWAALLETWLGDLL